MCHLLTLPTELLLEEILFHARPLDQQFLGSTCRALRACTKRLYLVSRNPDPAPNPTTLRTFPVLSELVQEPTELEKDPVLVLQWVIETGRKDWIKSFLLLNVVRAYMYISQMALGLIRYHNEKSLPRLMQLLPVVKNPFLDFMGGDDMNGIYYALLQGYNELCRDDLIAEAMIFDSSFATYVQRNMTSLSVEHILFVVKRSDFLTRIVPVALAKELWWTDVFAMQMESCLRHVLYDSKWISESGAIDTWIAWFKAVGLPSMCLYPTCPSFRVHWKLREFIRSQDPPIRNIVTRDWDVAPSRVGQYMHNAIIHDDVHDLEYILESIPLLVDMNRFRTTVMGGIELECVHKMSCRIPGIVDWCLKRALFKYDDFAPRVRERMKSNKFWVDRAKEIGMDK